MLASVIPVSAAAQEPDDSDRKPRYGHEITVSSCTEVAGICLSVGERRSMKPVSKPGGRTGPVVMCVWYNYGKDKGGWDDPDGTFPLSVLAVGGLYVFACYYQSDGSMATGYPRIVVYNPGEGVPGEAVNGWEVADYATNLLQFQRPRASVAPPTRQLVGTETWFAVTSSLSYPQRSAQAGRTWATVRASFSHATWDFGVHGRLRCTNHAAKRWNPSLPGSRQSSECTKVFTDTPAGSSMNARVTVTWDIYWTSNEHAGWRYFDDYSLSSAVPLRIVELQAVIR